MNPTRSPLNNVQITELRMAADKKLAPYHKELLKRLAYEHAYLREQQSDTPSQ